MIDHPDPPCYLHGIFYLALALLPPSSFLPQHSRDLKSLSASGGLICYLPCILVGPLQYLSMHTISCACAPFDLHNVPMCAYRAGDPVKLYVLIQYNYILLACTKGGSQRAPHWHFNCAVLDCRNKRVIWCVNRGQAIQHCSQQSRRIRIGNPPAKPWHPSSA